MEKQHNTNTIYHVLITSIIISLSFVSFALCIMCELNKSKKNALRVDGRLCYLPQSKAFGYGLAALMSSSGAQLIGTGLFISCTRSSHFKSCIATILLFLSWGSFLTMLILSGTATSMNRKQEMGIGWVDGDCYLVKRGIYIGSGTLVLIAMISMLLSCYLMRTKGRAVHAQVIKSETSTDQS